jgi:stage IV sporulation protein FB
MFRDHVYFIIAKLTPLINSIFMEESESPSFPSKPTDESQQQSPGKSIVSMIIFIGAFYLIFKWDITYIIVLACVILIHELGHYAAMSLFQYKDLSIFFVPLVGAFASGEKETVSQKQHVIILLAGPIPGVILGVILYYFGLRESNEFLIRTSNILIFLNLFNLLPIMPLDGGRVVKSLFFDSSQLINKIFLFLSVAILIFISIHAESYFLLIVPFFLIMQLVGQTHTKKIRDELNDKGIDVDKSFANLTDREYWLIREEILLQSKYYSRYAATESYVISDKEPELIKQVKNVIQKRPLKDLRTGGKILIIFIWLLMFIVPLIAIAFYYVKLGLIK